jgi:hypothetical protein
MQVKGKTMFFGCFFCIRIDGLFGYWLPKEKEGRIHGGAVGSRSHRQMARGESGFLSVFHMENRCVDDVCTRLAVSSCLLVALG